MVAVWVHDMGDFKKVTVTSSPEDPDTYAKKWWGLGQLVWSREVSGEAEGRALQKAILEAGEPCNPGDFMETKLTRKTCYVGEVDFDSLDWDKPTTQYHVYLIKLDETYYKCGYTSVAVPMGVEWAFAVSSKEKAKEFSLFVHNKLSYKRTTVEGKNGFIPKGDISVEYCIAQYKEWLKQDKPPKKEYQFIDL